MTSTIRAVLVPLALCAVGLVSCGPSPPAERVILVTLDTTRADRVGCYGHRGAATPSLDALAGENVLFEHAVAPVPATLPSHASLLTGLYPQGHGVRYNVMYSVTPDTFTLA